MTPIPQTRSTPDVLLEEAQREGRGRLKIFLGAAPGVGKTFAMLETARLMQKQGADVVAGIVETHGRADTQALVDGFEVLPPRRMDYRGRQFAELDVDALVQRRPTLALIDELAHSNIPGSRHVKRYQDVEDVLAAGIDVWTTLNVQHLESLNDVVARITGVRVRETLPDTVLEKADEIELIDLPSGDLLKRLDEGKVYLGEHAQQARQSFFTPANLTALRELAMRAAAERIDLQMQSLLRRHAVQGPWPTRDRLLVCVGGSAVSKSLVRAAARLAGLRGVQWIAVHVINSRASTLPDAAKDRIAETLRMAEQLGGEAVTIPGENVAQEILRYARSRNATQIVIARPRGPRLRHLIGRSVARSLMFSAHDIEVSIVPWEDDRAPVAVEAAPGFSFGSWSDFAWALLAAACATGLGVALQGLVGVPNLAMIYLLAVLFIALRLGAAAAMVSAVSSVLAFNFFFTEPRFTLVMRHHQDIITLVLLLVGAVFAGRLGAQIKGQMEALRKTARRTTNLNEFSRKVAGAMGREEVLTAVVEHVQATMQCDCAVIVQPPSPRVLAAARRGLGADYQFPASAQAAAQWSWEHAQPSGFSTNTLPSSDWLFAPLRVSKRVVGLLALHMRERRRPFSAGQKRLLDAIADQAAVALERVLLVSAVEDKRLASETEQLRAALLASVSHDLRTPLVSILGAASSLRSQGDKLAPEARVELLETIEDEAGRLNRFVQNLLDMTRLGHGKLQLNRDWCDVRDLLMQARKHLSRELARVNVEIDSDPVPGLIHVDPMLIEQVFINVLDNAAKYSPRGGSVRVAIHRQPDALVVEIEDEGPGIPIEDRERIFDQFYRVQSKDHIKPGTGLGLSICRGLLEAHGGSIRALSRLSGAGTLIRITLPQPAEAGKKVAHHD